MSEVPISVNPASDSLSTKQIIESNKSADNESIKRDSNAGKKSL